MLKCLKRPDTRLRSISNSNFELSTLATRSVTIEVKKQCTSESNAAYMFRHHGHTVSKSQRRACEMVVFHVRESVLSRSEVHLSNETAFPGCPFESCTGVHIEEHIFSDCRRKHRRTR